MGFESTKEGYKQNQFPGGEAYTFDRFESTKEGYKPKQLDEFRAVIALFRINQRGI